MSRPRPLLPLTARQHALVVAIRDYLDQHGFAPRQGEMAARFNRTTPTINEMVTTVVYKGWLGRAPRRPRGLQLTAAAQRALQPRTIACPHCGREFDNRQGAKSAKDAEDCP